MSKFNYLNPTSKIKKGHQGDGPNNSMRILPASSFLYPIRFPNKFVSEIL